MGRVTPIEARSAPPLVRRFFERGDPGPLLATLAQVPELLEVAAPFISAVLGASSIELRVKELVILRTSALMGCPFCTLTHAGIARRAGIGRDEVAALMEPRPIPGGLPDPDDQALVAWVDAVVAGGRAGAAASEDDVRSRFGEAGLVELVAVVGATMMLAVFSRTLELAADPRTVAHLASEGLA
ncbi:MAG: carboxymuconolactone decarboxylase family protein [Actinomycetota bacterium]